MIKMINLITAIVIYLLGFIATLVACLLLKIRKYKKILNEDIKKAESILEGDEYHSVTREFFSIEAVSVFWFAVGWPLHVCYLWYFWCYCIFNYGHSSCIHESIKTHRASFKEEITDIV